MIYTFNEKYTLEEQIEIVRDVRYNAPHDVTYNLLYHFFYIVGDLLHPVVKDCIVESELDKFVTVADKSTLRIQAFDNLIECNEYDDESCPYPEFTFVFGKYKAYFSSTILWSNYEPIFRKRGTRESELGNILINELHILTAIVESLQLKEQNQCT